MITLSQKLKKNEHSKTYDQHPKSRISIRDKLLPKEVQEMQSVLPNGATVIFPSPDNLHDFKLILCPTEGLYKNGSFHFKIFVPEEYNMMPPVVKCLTRLWHPNISENGDICLSLLRPHSLDGSGWSPTRRLKDVVWGLDSLFTDLLNFDDPLNSDAANMFLSDKVAFQSKVQSYIQSFCNNENSNY